ncbi:Uncharacterised protein [Bergeyella zoohelcum]|uniref:Uncharacterized protein n=1 Tax=Bergeyella zoohelcum TaxID=1015 RepID=A0A7Z9CH04_9FLAO|nr:Uncharacterised protein [Bergeyella zoohelcum]
MILLLKGYTMKKVEWNEFHRLGYFESYKTQGI